MDLPIIEIREAAFGYRGQPVVKVGGLELGSGQCLGVFGPNGSGKTTLVRGLAGLLSPQTGRVRRRDALRFGYLTQHRDLQLHWPMSGLDAANLAISAQQRFGWTRGACRKRVRHMMRQLDVERLAHRPFAKLSGGQQQRLMLAGALAAEPEVLILDEPTDGLDVRSRQVLIDVLNDARGGGLSTVIISHDIEDLMGLAQKIAWLHPAVEANQPSSVEMIGPATLTIRMTPTATTTTATTTNDMNALFQLIQDDYLPTVQVLWPALLAGLALAIGGAILGVFVLLRRETLVALSVPQIVTLGAAVALRNDWPTLPSALAAVAVALVLVAFSARRREGTILLLPALYVAGICISILLIANAGAHLIEVQNLFTGIDVAVGEIESIVAAICLVAAGLACAVLWRRWLLIAQAPAAAELARLRPARWNILFLILLAVVLVLGTDTVGIVMVITLLFLPAATVLPWSRRVPIALAAAVGTAVLFLAIGFSLSIEMQWPLSQSVGGAGFAIFLLSHVLSYFIA